MKRYLVVASVCLFANAFAADDAVTEGAIVPGEAPQILAAPGPTTAVDGPRWSIGTNALYDFNRNWNLDVAYAVHPHIDLGPSFLYVSGQEDSTVLVNGQVVSSSHSTTKGPELGFRANYYFVGAAEKGADGYVSAFVRGFRGHMQGQQDGASGKRDFTGIDTGLLGGTRYTWDSGLAFSFGGGISYIGGQPELIGNNGQRIPASAGIFDSNIALHIDAVLSQRF